MRMFQLSLQSACFFAIISSTALAQGTVLRQLGGAPDVFDPHLSTASNTGIILRDLLEGLVTSGADGKIIPGVAKSWSLSPDGRIYTFKLRENAKWSNGDPVTAHDFLYSMRRIINPETKARYATMLYPVLNAQQINQKKDGKTLDDLGVSVIDDYTLEIKLHTPTPYFLALLAHTVGMPLHKASVETFGDDYNKPGNFIGNGAFYLTQYDPKSQISMKKNQHFHDAANVKLDGATYKIITSAKAAADAFMTGQLHLTTDVPVEDILQLKDKLGEQVKFSPYLSTMFLIMQTAEPPFNDARVRRAVSMVLDRDYLSDHVTQGTMLPAFSVVPPGIDNYVDPPPELDYKMRTQSDREAEARTLLAAAGYTTGKKLTIEYRFNKTPIDRAIAEALADIWQRIDVKTELVDAEPADHRKMLSTKKGFQVARYTWNADYSDPQNFLFLMESSNTGLNFANYKDEQFDKLMQLAANEVHLDKRANLLAEAAKRGDGGHSFVPLLYNTNKNLVSVKLKGFIPNGRAANSSRFLSLVP